MAKVKASQTFVGTPEELEKYGGQVPTEFKKKESKMSNAEKQSFAGKITAGTEMEVSDERKKQLSEAGLIEGSDRQEPEGKKILVSDKPEKKAAATKETPKAKK
jgi:hypothetical protein